MFVGKPAMEIGYWLIGPVVNAARGARHHAQHGDALLALARRAGPASRSGTAGSACAALLAMIAQFADILDGLLARKLGVASDAGEALDAAVDRYVELFFLAGLAVHFRAHPMLLVVLAAIGGSFMVSYATAKAEALGVKAPRGVMRHGERVVYLLIASAFTPFARALTNEGTSLFLRDLPIVLAITVVAVVANISVVKRFAAIIAALAGPGRRWRAGSRARLGGRAAADGSERLARELLTASPATPSRALIAEWFRHHAAAVLATVVDYGTMIAGVELAGLAPVAATPIGALAGAITNFTANRYFTYRGASGMPARGQAWRFALVSGGEPRAQHRRRMLFHHVWGVQYMLARVITSIIVSNVWNYPMHETLRILDGRRSLTTTTRRKK